MVANMIPEVVQEKLGWQQNDIEALKEDMKCVKDEIQELKTDLSTLASRVEAQSKASGIAHDKLAKDIAEIKAWVVGGVKAILGAIITVGVAVLIRYLVG